MLAHYLLDDVVNRDMSHSNQVAPNHEQALEHGVERGVVLEPQHSARMRATLLNDQMTLRFERRRASLDDQMMTHSAKMKGPLVVVKQLSRKIEASI